MTNTMSSRFTFDAEATRIEDSVREHLLEHENAIAYMLGGRSTFTLVGRRESFTYKIKNAKNGNVDNPNLKFVHVRIGHEYVYMGTIQHRNGEWFFYLDKGRKEGLNYGKWQTAREPLVNPNQMEVKGFTFVWNKLWQGQTINDLQIWATANCCRCGRNLTKANSIADRMGPVCHKKHTVLLAEIEEIIARRKKQMQNN